MKTNWKLDELHPYQNEPLHISGTIDISQALLDKTSDILEAQPSQVDAYIFYNAESQDYQLSMSVETDLVLLSTRSLKPVSYHQSLSVNEIYLTENNAEKIDEYEDQAVFVLEEDVLDIRPVLLENIILALPIQVLTEEESKGQEMPKGQDWQVISEHDYFEEQRKFSQENSPFNELKSLFQDELDDE